MSYNDRKDGYKGIGCGAGIAILLGMFLFMRACTALLAPASAPGTPEEAARLLLNDPKTRVLAETIQRTYPDEFAGIVRELARRGANNQTSDEITNGVNDYIANAEKRHAEELAQAPHDALVAYRRTEISVIANMATKAPETCAEYFGAGGVQSASADQASAIAEIKARQWEAAAAGRDRPAGRIITPPTRGEIRTITVSAVADGFPEEMVNTFFVGGGVLTPTDKRCGLGLSILRAIDSLPPERADDFTGFLSRESGTSTAK